MATEWVCIACSAFFVPFRVGFCNMRDSSCCLFAPFSLKHCVSCCGAYVLSTRFLATLTEEVKKS